MIVKYTVSSDEYVESQSAYRIRMARGRMLFRNLYGLACLAAILGIYVRLSGSPGWGDVLFLVASIFLLERALLWRVRAAAAYRSTPGVREPVELKIEESNLVRASAAGSPEIRWRTYWPATKPGTCSCSDWALTSSWCFPNGRFHPEISLPSKNFGKKS